MEITELDKTLVHIAILELWEKFMPEKTYELDGVERLNLEMYKDNFYVLTQWLKNDVIYLISLTYSEREQQIAFLEEINSWIKERLGTELYSKITKSEFSLEKIKRRLEIQSDWERAIDDVEFPWWKWGTMKDGLILNFEMLSKRNTSDIRMKNRFFNNLRVSPQAPKR